MHPHAPRLQYSNCYRTGERPLDLNSRYLSTWLRDRGFSPQKPQRVPRERDPEAVAAWLESDWPRIKKRRDGKEPKSL